MDDVEAMRRAFAPELDSKPSYALSTVLVKEDIEARLRAAIATLFERMMVPTPAMLSTAKRLWPPTELGIWQAMLRAKAAEMGIEVKG